MAGACRRAVALYTELMKTLTITEGRANLGHWLRLAAAGQDVGFVLDGKVIALRPVEVHSADYALQEYGLGEPEMAAAERRIKCDLKAARARGETSRFTGGRDDFR